GGRPRGGENAVRAPPPRDECMPPYAASAACIAPSPSFERLSMAWARPATAARPRSDDARRVGAPGSESPPGEWRPAALGLRQTIGDDRERGDVMPDPAVAALDDDVLAPRTGVLEAAPPRDDPVAAAEDRGRRDGQRGSEIRAFPGTARGAAHEPCDGGGGRVAKRA